MIPAGHTDLVMPAIGEEFGYAGVLVIALLFVFLFHRALVAARGAPDEYGFFLALGFGALIALRDAADFGRGAGSSAALGSCVSISEFG